MQLEFSLQKKKQSKFKEIFLSQFNFLYQYEYFRFGFGLFKFLIKNIAILVHFRIQGVSTRGDEI